MKKTLAIVLSVLMALSVFAVAASAFDLTGYTEVHWTTEGLSEGDLYFSENFAQMMSEYWGKITYYYNTETGAVKAISMGVSETTYEPNDETAISFRSQIKIYHVEIEEDLIDVKKENAEHGDWYVDYSAANGSESIAHYTLDQYTFKVGAISKKIVLIFEMNGTENQTTLYPGDDYYEYYKHIIKVKHDFGDWTITDDGHSAACTYEGCGYVEEGAHVDKALEYTPASCTVGSAYTYQCVYCKREYTKTNEAPGHTWEVTETIEPTEGADGVIKYDCKYCDATKSEAIHVWGEGVESTPATCTEAGEKTFGCVNCEATTTEPIEALDHDFDDTIEANVTIVAATCTEAGSKTVKCSRCDETDVTELEALGHAWSEWEVTKEATDSEAGEKTRHCTREGCDATETEEIPVVKLNFFQKIVKFFRDFFAKIKAFFQSLGKK